MSLQPNKRSGYDNSNQRDKKLFGEQLALPLVTILTNRSLVGGIVPQELKIAKIIPVFKR